MPIDPAQRCVPCPTCGDAAVLAPSNRWRPFCSARCAGADLGAWASEGYRVEAAASTDEPNDNDTPNPAPH